VAQCIRRGAQPSGRGRALAPAQGCNGQMMGKGMAPPAAPGARECGLGWEAALAAIAEAVQWSPPLLDGPERTGHQADDVERVARLDGLVGRVGGLEEVAPVGGLAQVLDRHLAID
jgi:hypothetical protein